MTLLQYLKSLKRNLIWLYKKKRKKEKKKERQKYFCWNCTSKCIRWTLKVKICFNLSRKKRKKKKKERKKKKKRKVFFNSFRLTCLLAHFKAFKKKERENWMGFGFNNWKFGKKEEIWIIWIQWVPLNGITDNGINQLMG